MGFIGYSTEQRPEGELVRIYLECEDQAAAGPEPAPVTYASSVEVLFPSGEAPCKLRGVDTVLVLKKFYKLSFSLEERAREHGHNFRVVFDSAERLVEHLGYTRNARRFSGEQKLVQRPGMGPESREEPAEPLEKTG